MSIGEVGGPVGLADELTLLRAHVATLTAALESNRTIAVAVGLVMQSHGLDRDQAFAWLVSQSQHRNVKLRHVAAELVGAAEGRSHLLNGAPTP